MIQKPRETSLVPHFTQGTTFSSYDRVVQVKSTYGPKAISGGTTYGKQDTGSTRKVPLMDNEESTVLSIFMKY